MNPSYDIKIVFEALPKLISYLPMTLFLTAMPLILGLALGAVIMVMKDSKRRWIRLLAQFYIFSMRATPPLIQIFLIYYGIPALLLQIGININGWGKVVFAIFALTFNSAAYLAEILRSSFSAVSKGQFEAAASIGMSQFDTYTRIIIPQAFKVFLPGFCNYAIMLLKDTSMVCLIGVMDLMGGTNNYMSATYGLHRLENLTSAAIIYWVVSKILEIITGMVEKRVGDPKNTNGWEREAIR